MYRHARGTILWSDRHDVVCASATALLEQRPGERKVTRHIPAPRESGPEKDKAEGGVATDAAPDDSAHLNDNAYQHQQRLLSLWKLKSTELRSVVWEGRTHVDGHKECET